MAVARLAGGGLSKVEEGEHQGEKEKNCRLLLSHPQETELGETKLWMGVNSSEEKNC